MRGHGAGDGAAEERLDGPVAGGLGHLRELGTERVMHWCESSKCWSGALGTSHTGIRRIGWWNGGTEFQGRLAASLLWVIFTEHPYHVDNRGVTGCDPGGHLDHRRVAVCVECREKVSLLRAVAVQMGSSTAAPARCEDRRTTARVCIPQRDRRGHGRAAGDASQHTQQIPRCFPGRRPGDGMDHGPLRMGTPDDSPRGAGDGGR
jgi:hypothetical protein